MTAAVSPSSQERVRLAIDHAVALLDSRAPDRQRDQETLSEALGSFGKDRGSGSLPIVAPVSLDGSSRGLGT